MVRERLDLLPKEALVRTGGTAHAAWNHRPIIGRVLRSRHALALSLLPRRCDRLLEAGYGSGTTMLELARRCDALYGIDVHDKAQDVAAALARFGVDVDLCTGDIRAMPYDDAFFDCILAESLLAHVSRLDDACAELRRVLRPRGSLVVVVPGQSRLVDGGLRMLTGVRARDEFVDRSAVVPALRRHFDVEQQYGMPRRGIVGFRLYTGLRLRPRN